MLKQHPKGIMILFFTEMWERFGFYTLMAIYVLYMDKEFGWSDSTKGNFYSAFLGAVYFIPLLGGYIGDKLWGQLKTVEVGSVIMILGYAGLAISSVNLLLPFYLGLILIAFGTGIFKVNISVLIGNLYRDKPELKDAGYNIYYMGVNVGAALAPLAATLISNIFHSYNLSFWAASIGMALSLIIFEFGKKKLLHVDVKRSVEINNQGSVSSVQLMSKKEEFDRIITLIILFLIVIFFWIAFYQNGFALTLFAERSTVKLDYLRPETYQFFDPAFILIFTPIMLWIFNRLNARGKEPSTPSKIFFGMLLMGVAMIVMVYASLKGGNSDVNIMSPMWLIITYLIVTISEILISPMGLSFVSKVAPPRFAGVMMGGWFSATAVGSYLSGVLGKYYSNFQHHEYFLILTGLLGFSAVLVLISMKKLKRFTLKEA